MTRENRYRFPIDHFRHGAIRWERLATLALMLVCWLGMAPNKAVAVDVWVDFISDFHDGDGPNADQGGEGPAVDVANGVADWIDELNQGAAAAGIAAFTDEERATIEGIIIADLNEIYGAYNINFVLEQPAGEHDVIYFGRDNDNPAVALNNRGVAPLDFGNRNTQSYTDQDGDPSGVVRVTTANGVVLDVESDEPRAQQIAELATSLAGTAASELGQTFGLLPQFAYSNSAITPDTFADTGGVQNQHVTAGPTTGLTEEDREVRRSLSPFSQVILDIAGGSEALSMALENNPLVDNPIISDRDENANFMLGTDAGDTLVTAQPLVFATGDSSGQEISFVEADLDETPGEVEGEPATDVDLFSFSTAVPATLTSHVFSEALAFGAGEFDAVLELLDADGAVIAANDDVAFDDNVFDDQESPEATGDDAFLLNISLEPGDYFLRVSPATDDIGNAADVGNQYYLVTALALLDELETPELPGDYNGDGEVNLADFTVWRDTLGELVENPFDGADGDGDGVIGVGDFQVFTDFFGETLDPPATLVAVPEPATVYGLLIAAAAAATPRRRRTRR